jgi:hypothetical protein|tara:strand:+ start:155 stop:874 length:720 start_codon:yes stop_codon:yes gene_type:complete
MIKTIINEEEAFAVNEDFDARLWKFGQHKVPVLVVDNFYKNPDMVRQLALDIPASTNKRIRGGNPAQRINAFYELSGMAWAFDQLSRTYFPEIMKNKPFEYMQNSFMNATFMVNVMQSDKLPPLVPHQDNPSGTNLASTIYLNNANECNGGTSFYEFGGETGFTDQVQLKDGNVGMDVAGTVTVTKYITDSSHDWKMIGLVPMQYNRMVLYNQALLHTAYVTPSMFTDTIYRINQQFFI